MVNFNRLERDRLYEVIEIDGERYSGKFRGIHQCPDSGYDLAIFIKGNGNIIEPLLGDISEVRELD